MDYPEPTKTVARVFHSEIVDEYIPERIDALRQTRPEDISDPMYRDAAALVRGLQENQVRELSRLARLVAVDSVASILGIIQGSSCPEGLDREFRITYGGTDITGDLLDAFLSVEELSLKS